MQIKNKSVLTPPPEQENEAPQLQQSAIATEYEIRPSVIEELPQVNYDDSVFPVTRMVAPAVAVEKAVETFSVIQALKKRVLNESDYYTTKIQGKTVKAVRKSGYRKMALVLGISDEILDMRREEWTDNNGVRQWTWRIIARAVHRPSGRAAIGVGAASTTERSFTHPEHDTLALASTRAKSRAISDIIGSGEPAAEELE